MQVGANFNMVWQVGDLYLNRQKKSDVKKGEVSKANRAEDKQTVFYMFLSGGTLEMEDLQSFQVQVVDAWKVPLGDTKMHIPPPPAGGALLAFILQLMKGFMYCLMSLLLFLNWPIVAVELNKPFNLNNGGERTKQIVVS